MLLSIWSPTRGECEHRGRKLEPTVHEATILGLTRGMDLSRVKHPAGAESVAVRYLCPSPSIAQKDLGGVARALGFNGGHEVSVQNVAATLAERLDIEEKEVLARACAIGWEMVKERTGTKSTPPSGRFCRKTVQSEMRQSMALSWRDGRKGIALIEGSTGIGKTRVMIECAEMYAKEKPTHPMVLAVPGIGHMSHVAREMRIINSQLRTCWVLGKRQYVSPSILMEHLNELECASPEHLPSIRRLRKWIVEEGGAPPRNSKLGSELRVHLPNVAYLRADAELLAPDLPLDGCTLQECTLQESIEEDVGMCPAMDLYREQRHAAEHVHRQTLTITTHAFLGQHIQRINQDGDGGLLKMPIGLLLVDEVHLLESGLAKVLTSDVSFFSLRARLSSPDNIKELKSLRLAAAAEKCREAISTFLSHEASDTRSRQRITYLNIPAILSDSSHPKYQQISELRKVLPEMARLKATKSKDKEIQIIKKAVSTITHAYEGRGNVILNTSPIKRYPRLILGPRSLERYLSKLWQTTESAVGLSATIYNRDSHGAPSASYHQKNLAIPLERYQPHAPWIAPYIYTLPTLHLPSRDTTLLPFPPHQEEENTVTPELRKYYSRMAKVVSFIADQSAGGVLVLVPSFRDCHEIGSALESPLSGRLIVQSASKTSTHIHPDFMAAGRANLRPVWIGTGNAWTGLDLRDNESTAAEDLILTDLVITRIPYNTNRSSTHIARTMRRGKMTVSAELLETQIHLRQGLGRLIRRDNVKNRNIWFCDVRYHLSGSNGQLARKVAKPILERYQNRVEDI